VNRQLLLHQELRHGLRQNQFDASYRPRVNLLTGAVDAVELTPFWMHPQKGKLAYTEFAKPIDESGLATLFNYWLIDRVCADISRMKAAGCAKKMVLSIEPEHLFCEKFLAYLSTALNESALDGALLEFEISQTIVNDGLGAIKRGIERLNKMNISVGLDHFGSGHSSFLHLQRLPIKTLKIDSDFIADAPQNGDESNLVSALIYLAHSLKKVIVASGVERIDQHQLLRALQCDQAQGSYYKHDLSFESLCRYFVGSLEEAASR